MLAQLHAAPHSTTCNATLLAALQYVRATISEPATTCTRRSRRTFFVFFFFFFFFLAVPASARAECQSCAHTATARCALTRIGRCLRQRHRLSGFGSSAHRRLVTRHRHHYRWCNCHSRHRRAAKSAHQRTLFAAAGTGGCVSNLFTQALPASGGYPSRSFYSTHAYSITTLIHRHHQQMEPTFTALSWREGADTHND